MDLLKAEIERKRKALGKVDLVQKVRGRPGAEEGAEEGCAMGSRVFG